RSGVRFTDTITPPLGMLLLRFALAHDEIALCFGHHLKCFGCNEVVVSGGRHLVLNVRRIGFVDAHSLTINLGFTHPFSPHILSPIMQTVSTRNQTAKLHERSWMCRNAHEMARTRRKLLGWRQKALHCQTRAEHTICIEDDA